MLEILQQFCDDGFHFQSSLFGRPRRIDHASRAVSVYNLRRQQYNLGGREAALSSALEKGRSEFPVPGERS
jgi:hypothetical protein